MDSATWDYTTITRARTDNQSAIHANQQNRNPSPGPIITKHQRKAIKAVPNARAKKDFQEDEKGVDTEVSKAWYQSHFDPLPFEMIHRKEGV